MLLQITCFFLNFPTGFGPAPPPPTTSHSAQLAAAAAAEQQRRLQDQLVAAEQAAQQRANAERQYAERMSAALSQDPLVRLQVGALTKYMIRGG